MSDEETYKEIKIINDTILKLKCICYEQLHTDRNEEFFNEKFSNLLMQFHNINPQTNFVDLLTHTECVYAEHEEIFAQNNVLIIDLLENLILVFPFIHNINQNKLSSFICTLIYSIDRNSYFSRLENIIHTTLDNFMDYQTNDAFINIIIYAYSYFPQYALDFRVYVEKIFNDFTHMVSKCTNDFHINEISSFISLIKCMCVVLKKDSDFSNFVSDYITILYSYTFNIIKHINNETIYSIGSKLINQINALITKFNSYAYCITDEFFKNLFCCAFVNRQKNFMISCLQLFIDFIEVYYAEKKYVVLYVFSMLNIGKYIDIIIPSCFDESSLRTVNKILEIQINMYPIILINIDMEQKSSFINEMSTIIKSSTFLPIAKCQAINIIELVLSNTEYDLSQLHEFYDECFIQNVISLLNISFDVHKGTPIILLMHLFQKANDEMKIILLTLFTEIPQLIDENINDFEANGELQEAITFICTLNEE